MNITTGKIAKAQRVVIYGSEGIGKSTFAAQFPNPLFIDTEGSTSNMDVTRFEKPSSWTMLQQQVDYVKTNRPCKTLIIDTIDWAESMAIKHICDAANVDGIEGFGYGAGYIKLEEELGRFLNKLQDLIEIGINVVLTAHAQIKKFEQPDEMGAYDRYELKLGKKTTAKTSALVKEWGDMVLFCKYKTLSVAADKQGTKFKGQGGARVICTTHRPAWDAKNRFDLPDEIPMDFGAIAHIFNTSPAAATATAQTPAVTQPLPNSNEPKFNPETGEVIEDSPTTFDPSTVPPMQESSDNQFPVSTPGVDYNSDEYMGVPQTLLDLMKIENVTAKEIMDLTHQKFIGTFPSDMEFKNLPNDFINQALIPNWEKALNGIKENRELAY